MPPFRSIKCIPSSYSLLTLFLSPPSSTYVTQVWQYPIANIFSFLFLFNFSAALITMRRWWRSCWAEEPVSTRRTMSCGRHCTPLLHVAMQDLSRSLLHSKTCSYTTPGFPATEPSQSSHIDDVCSVASDWAIILCSLIGAMLVLRSIKVNVNNMNKTSFLIINIWTQCGTGISLNSMTCNN